MMYSPGHYIEEREDLIFDVIENYGFATVITQDQGKLSISHLPLLLDKTDGKVSLVGHCAKANNQWKLFSSEQSLTALFHGPHSYISPAWYQPKASNVPTWNYVTVHVEGTATILDDPKAAYKVLQKTTEKFENEYQTGWSLPAEPNSELESLLKGIVAFRIDIANIQAKFKLSQKQGTVDRDNVVRELSQLENEQRNLADYMVQVMKTEAK